LILSPFAVLFPTETKWKKKMATTTAQKRDIGNEKFSENMIRYHAISGQKVNPPFSEREVYFGTISHKTF
jgi:hypothetical protein